MKILFLFILTITHSYALTEKELTALGEKEGDDKKLKQELQIFPNSGEMINKVRMTYPQKTPVEPLEVTSKTVQGKYIVCKSILNNEFVTMDYLYAISFDDETQLYKMWVKRIIKHDDVDTTDFLEFDGLRVTNTKIICWTQIPNKKNPELHSMTVTKIEDGKELWQTVDYGDGKLLSILEGELTSK